MDPEGLKQFELFASLAEADLSAIAEQLSEEHFAAGTRIFAEGDQGEQLYLLAEGGVRISKIVHDTGEEALAILRPTAWFGEMSLLDDEPRSAEAVADSDTTCLVLSRAGFTELMQENPRVALSMLTGLVRTLAARLRETNDQVKAMHLMAMW